MTDETPTAYPAAPAPYTGPRAEQPAVIQPVAQTPPGWYFDERARARRWWDGNQWTENFAPPAKNGAATAALVLGLIGIFVTPVPFFFGLLLGGPIDLLAVILGIVGITKAGNDGRGGTGRAVWGLVLGAMAGLSIFLGAGTIW